jgi:hypothetical protein
MKRIYLVCFIFCIMINLYAQGQKKPFFENDRIFFPANNSSVQIKPLTELKNDVNNNAYEVIDSFEIIDDLRRVIIATRWKYSNSYEYEISFYNFNGELINKTQKISGVFEILILKKAERILFAQKSLLLKLNDSFLYDLNGKLVERIFHDFENQRTGYSNNEEYIWFITYKMRDAKEGDILLYPSVPYVSYNHIMFFEAHSGKFIKEIDIESSGLVSINVNGIVIEIELPEADIPG